MPRLKKTETKPSGSSPQVFRQTVSEDRGLPHRGTRANAQWYYAAHPERWGWDDEAKDFLPRLKMVSLTPGSMGASSNREGKITGDDKVDAAWAELGWRAIKPWDTRLGPWRDYVVGFNLARGGLQWMPKWVEPRLIGKRVRFVADNDQRREFLSYLVDKGLIEPMDEVIRDELVSKQRRRLTTIEADVMANPSNALIAARLERERVKLAAMMGEDEEQAREEAQRRAQELRKAAKDAQDKVEVKV